MSSVGNHFSKKVLYVQFNPSVSFIRHGHRKPNTKRPAVPSWERASMDAVTKPKYPEYITTKIPPWMKTCKELAQIQAQPIAENKYEQLLVADVKKLLSTKKMVIVCQNNAADSYSRMDARILLFKNQMAFDTRGSKIYRLATEGTEYEKCHVLFQGQTCLIHSDSSENLTKFMKIEKKIPFAVVLGGIVEGRIMDKDQLLWYANLPDIQTLRGELVSILGSAASRLSQNLSHHQTTLSQNLNQFVQDRSKSESSE